MRKMSALAIRGSIRFVAGCLGMGVGWIIWSALWANFTAEVSAATFENLRSSSTFGVMLGLLAAFLIVGFGMLLSTLADHAVVRFNRARPTSSVS